MTFPWSSAPGPYGVPGTDSTETGRPTGPLTGRQGNHGSMSPWTVRNTFLAWGVDFNEGLQRHFAAMEAPEFLVGDVRRFFRKLGGQ